MKLRTEFVCTPSLNKISHGDCIYFSGSCFSENIAALLSYHGFHVSSNSHGIIYNPVSIKNSIQDIAQKREYTNADIESINSEWISFNHHGEFKNADAENVLEKINQNISDTYQHIQKSKYIFITLGSSWVYTHYQSNKIVANCHKFPSTTFQKRILSISEINDAIKQMIEFIYSVNKSIRIVFTLSPVKHLRDGIVENQLSKSRLHHCIQEHLNENISYFPAFEIMNDDLRDYRFWSEDMMHPNQLAIDYIWEKFSNVYFDSSTLEINQQVKSVRQFLAHRILSSDQIKAEELKTQQEKKKVELLKKYPQIHFEE